MPTAKDRSPDSTGHTPRSSLEQAVLAAAQFLPTQGPIEVFVHHNTLHAFEDYPFDEGVQAGGRLLGCQPYLSEARYRDELRRGRIRPQDLEAVLLEDLGDEADTLVALFGTRYYLRLAMLQQELQAGSDADLQWVLAETDALRSFSSDIAEEARKQMVEHTQHWVLHGTPPDVTSRWEKKFDLRRASAWPDSHWEQFVLRFLWDVCWEGACLSGEAPTNPSDSTTAPIRHRDMLLEATGEDADLPVHETLIRLCSAFLDQGFAEWELPNRQHGLFSIFLQLYGKRLSAPTHWFRSLQREVMRLQRAGTSAYASIEESLEILGVRDTAREPFITQSLLALRGWAGMVWQMETNAEWAPRPAPAGSLVEFLAVRLILERVALKQTTRKSLGRDIPLSELREALAGHWNTGTGSQRARRAFTLFQMAQRRQWSPEELRQLSAEQWRTIVHEIEAFSEIERRRVFHLAFERKYRQQTLNAVLRHAAHRSRTQTTGQRTRLDRAPTAYQVVCCIDDREESFRRHLEEIDPACETFGMAGFFGVAMYYRGAGEAHFRPLCPVNVVPRQYVVEQPLYSLTQTERRRAKARQTLGQATHQTHRVTRSFLGGFVMGLVGTLAVFPLVVRVLFPRTTARFRQWFVHMMKTPNTELRLERTIRSPGPENGSIGYSVEEMVTIVENGLRTLGLIEPSLLSPLVVICGHGSASLNNPHEAAYDCGACGGGRGGPNARAFAQMANDARVRHELRARGLTIPVDTYFMGCFHNTCDDSVLWYDLDRVPQSHRPLFQRVQSKLDEARKQNARERCRRFASADLSLSAEEATRHVEVRSQDLSQTRPECGHATNALCFVGRREWSRGLFLDRRAFLTSYDPTQDDEQSSILEGLLQAVIPVCAGINLEYYFSYVDPQGYGSGTKLPHNITSLLGVMNGASSDLRPGLPWQMVEIHEPMRLLFVVETTPTAMRRIIEDNPTIARLVNGGWVQLSVFDADKSQIHQYQEESFVPYEPEPGTLPKVNTSSDWYGGSREHLDFASVVPSPKIQETSFLLPAVDRRIRRSPTRRSARSEHGKL